MLPVTVGYNLLPVELIQRIKQIPLGSKTHRSNYSSWKEDVIHTSGPVLIYDIEGELLEEIAQHVHKFMDVSLEDYQWYAMYYLWGRLSYIPWHNDGGHFAACTVYVNDFWNRDWGGALLYENSPNDIRAVYPEFNKAITFRPPVLHATMLPSLNAPMREAVQIFVHKKNTGENGSK